ncbi:phosphotransferase enzyme family protein [Dasania marina]|uniref:phosphotransferase enzyme family protein n=1 Tax=Dasania marina TaxID=471499 RepID=UPI00035D18B8|nr:phosphotransferase [Dasania marina]
MNTFYQQSLAQQEEQLLRLAYSALPAWGLEGHLSLIKHRENAVYRLTTADNQLYALRIHRANYHSDASLHSELSWVNALQGCGIEVPNAIPTQTGAFFTLASLDSIPETRQIDLLSWVDGKQIGSIEDGLSDSPEQIQKNYFIIGQVAAQIHNQASQWPTPEGFQRHSWGLEDLVGEEPFWGPFWELQALSPVQRSLILKARKTVRKGLMTLSTDSADYSMIHADLVPENVLVNANSVQIIDFDDAGFGWHLFEIATALYFIQFDQHYEIAKQALIAGYRQHRPLSDQKLAQLPLLMVARGFTYLGWVHTRQNTETALESTPHLINLCCRTIEQYIK